MRDVFKCKDHKFNTFPLCSEQTGGRAILKERKKSNGESDGEMGKGICDKKKIEGVSVGRDTKGINKAR